MMYKLCEMRKSFLNVMKERRMENGVKNNIYI